MAVPQIRGATSGISEQASGVTTLAVPGSVVGDLLVAFVMDTYADTIQVPSGWTQQYARVVNSSVACFTKIATVNGEGFSTGNDTGYTFGRNWVALLVAITGVDSAAPVNAIAGAGGSGTTLTAPSVTTTVEQTLVLAGILAGSTVDLPTPSGTTDIVERTSAASGLVASFEHLAAGATGPKSSTVNQSVVWDGIQVAIAPPPNTPPYTPTLVTPADAAVLDRQQAQTFSWQFSDPNQGDSQSAYNWAYRLSGAPTWTETGWVTSTATQHTIAGATFTAGNYEWRVRTKDAQGLESPWSSVGFFTAADAPPGPTITDPPNGGTISAAEYLVTWSTPNQDAYQLQVLNGETVLVDTGQVNQPTARSRPVQFPDNNVTRTIRLRILYDGLWSQWSTATVTVSYTPPPVPWVTATPVDVGAGVPSAIRVDVEDPRLRVDARNLATDPRATRNGLTDQQIGFNAAWFGPGGNAGTTTPVTDATDGPLPEVTSYLRKTWTVVNTIPQAVSFSFSAPSWAVTPGDTYSFSVYYRTSWVNTGNPAVNRIEARFFDASGTQIELYGSPNSAYATAPNEWKRIGATFTIPTGAVRAQVGHNFYASVQPPVGSTLDATALLAEKSATVGPYFDGSFPPDGTYTYRWTGPVNDSTSERLAYGTTGELAESTEPLVVAHDVWVRGGPEGEIRLAADLPASLPYLWHLPASGVEYEFRARAIGDNGTSSWSDWTP